MLSFSQDHRSDMINLNKIFILVPLFLVGLSSKGQYNTQSIDFYYQLTDSLKSGAKVSDSTWESFFNLEANTIFLSKYKPLSASALKAKFRQAVEDAYTVVKPGDTVDQKNIHSRHIRYLQQNETAVKEFLRTINTSPFLDSAYRLAYKYLPTNMRVPVKGLTIYFSAPIIPNALAKGSSIYINTCLEHMLGSVKPGVMVAHELHHLLVKRRTFKSVPKSNELPILFLSNQISREGIADLIDKKYLSSLTDSSYNNIQQRSLSNSDSIVINFDREISRLMHSTDSRPKIDKNALKGYTGHTPGYYMAQIIERNGYLGDLLTDIDNPFHFMIVYNKAARADNSNPPQFSPESILFLESISNKVYGN